MKVRKIPMRLCVITRERLPKGELLRVVRTPENEIVVDITGKANGRGSYIKKDLDVLIKARKGRVLEKKLECSFSDEVYENIEKIIKNEK